MTMSWAEDFQPVVYQFFMAGVEMVDSLIPAIYNVQNSTGPREYFKGIEATDTEGWNTYKDTGITSYANFDDGFEKTFQHYNYTRRFKLLQDYIEDNTISSVARIALQGLGLSAAEKREQDAASIFNNAWSTGAYAGPDAAALCSASHPYSRANADTYDNTGVEAFSYEALKTARANMRAWTNGLGLPLRRNGTLILHPIGLIPQVDEIINATGKPTGIATNEANAVRGFSSLAWDELTDAESWFLLDPRWTKMSLFWFNRVPLYNEIVERATTHVVYEFRMRYSYGFIDPRFVYGNQV